MDNTIKNNIEELPNNIEAEQSVIGSILISNEIFDEISILISNKNFYDPMHQKIFNAIENLISKGMLANPITLKNYFEKEKDELNIPDYLIKITKFSTSLRQSVEYSKLIYDLFVKRELIKISNNISDAAKLNDLNNDGQKIIENFEFIKTIKKFPVYLHTVVQKENWREMPAMIDLAEKYGFEKVYFTQIGDWNTGIDMEEQRKTFALPEYQLMASEVDKNKISRLF